MATPESEVAARVLRLLRPVRPLPATAVTIICAGAVLIAAAPAVLLAWLALPRHQGPYGP